MLNRLNEQLGEREDLTDEQVALAVGQLLEAEVSDELKADYLCALARKGETAEEIGAFARELRARALTPPIDAQTRADTILDVCGTGGDRLNTFNISTTVALICAAAGLAVAIPTHAGYNYLVNRVNEIVLDMEKAANEIVNIVTEPPAQKGP